MLRAVTISLLLATGPLGAQTPGLRPEDYFHLGATNYIFDKREEARAATAEGLKRYPNDGRLKGLAGLAAREAPSQQQQQQSQSQQGQSDQKQDQQSQKSQQQKEEEKKQQSQQQKEQQKEQQQARQQTNQPPPQPQDASEQKETEAAAAAGQMTPEQARQLLDSQKSEEQLLPIKPKEKQVDRSRHFKD